MGKTVKFPVGPSAPGAAGARALDAVGGHWQHKVGPGFTAKLSGDFLNVITYGAEYVSWGRTRADKPEGAPRACAMYQVPFAPAATEYAEVSTGGGVYFSYGASSLALGAQRTHTYPVGGVDVLYYSRQLTREIEGRFLNFYGGKKAKGVFTVALSEPASATPTPGGDGLRVSVPAAQFARLGGTEKAVYSVCTVAGGRTDPAGRELEDIGLLVWPRKADAYGFTINATAFTRSNAEFFSAMPGAVTQNYFAFLALEKFFVAQATASASGFQPKAWLFRALAGDPESIQLADVTAQMFDRAYYPDPEPIGSPSVLAYYPTPVTAIANAYSANAMALASTCALPGNVVLVSYPLLRIRPGATLADVDPLRWYLRVARVALGTMTATVVIDEELPLPIRADRLPNGHIQSLTHVGNGVVIGKKISGFAGTDLAVRFLRSTDSGLTWAEFDPTGVGSTAVNQNLGEFIVHRPATANSNGVLLMPAWDSTKSAYFVFESTDLGTSWRKKGMIAKPDAFYRIDTMLGGDGGGNFNRLLPGPDPTRAVDVSIPDRYNPA